MKKFIVAAIPAVLIAYHLVRIELVAKAQSTNTASPTTDSTAPKARGSLSLAYPYGGIIFATVVWVVLGLPAIQKELGIEKGDSQDEAIQKLNSTFVYENQSTLTKLHEEHRDDTKANRDKAIHDALMAAVCQGRPRSQESAQAGADCQIASNRSARCRRQCFGRSGSCEGTWHHERSTGKTCRPLHRYT